MQLNSFAYRLTRAWQPVTWLAYATQAPERLGCLAGCLAGCYMDFLHRVDILSDTFSGEERMPIPLPRESSGGMMSKLSQPNGNLLLRGCIRGKPSLVLGFLFLR